MHIGFDVSQTGTAKAGCGYYAHALAKALLEAAPQHRFALYPGFGDFYFDPAMPLRRSVHRAPRRLRPAAPHARERAAFWNASTLEEALGNPDVVHANNFWCPVQLRRSRLVYTLYDLAFLVDATWSTEANRVGCFEGVFRAAVAADWLVAISEASRRHFLATFPHFPADRVRVIHPCSRFVDTHEQGTCPRALRSVPSGRFWLSVGTIEPRKNQRLLVQAYAQYLARGGAPMPLVLAGGKGWLMEDFPRFLEELGVAGQVIVTGYVTDAELTWLYRNCYANLYPSLFEGFGLPVLEGMQFGAPDARIEQQLDPRGGGRRRNPAAARGADAWTEAMLRLAGSPAERTAMADRSRARAAHFDWQRSAAQLLALYDDALAQPKRSLP